MINPNWYINWNTHMDPEYDNMSIRDKIRSRIDLLQMQMEAGLHLSDPSIVLGNINNVSKFWAVLEEEDRDYLQVARDALEEKREWVI